MKSSYNLKKWSLFVGIGLTTMLLATFSLLWIRNQVTIQSRYGQILEEEFETICRQIRNVNAQMAYIQSPQFLRRHYCKELSAPAVSQMVWISSNTHSDQSQASKAFLTLNAEKVYSRFE